MNFNTPLVLLLISLPQICFAQNALIYTSPENFLDNKNIPATVSVHEIESEKLEWWNATVYEITTDNKSLNRQIRSVYFAIEHHDSLFINCSNLINVKCYANVRMRAGKYLLFSSVPSKKREHKEYMPDNHLKPSGLIVPVVTPLFTGIIAPSYAYNKEETEKMENEVRSKSRFCYLYNLENGNTQVLTPDVMTELLLARQDLQKEYIMKRKPNNENVYFYYLSKLYTNE